MAQNQSLDYQEMFNSSSFVSKDFKSLKRVKYDSSSKRQSDEEESQIIKRQSNPLKAKARVSSGYLGLSYHDKSPLHNKKSPNQQQHTKNAPSQYFPKHLVSIHENVLLPNPFPKKNTTNIPKQKLDDYDLVLYKNINNQRYIKSLSYYDFLTLSLKVSARPMLRKQIFNVSRETDPSQKSKEFCESDFTSIVYIQLPGTDICADQEFEDLKEKHVQLENYWLNRYGLEEKSKYAKELYEQRLKKTCPICRKFFDDFASFVKNYVNCLVYTVQKNDRNIQCSFCSKRFLNKLSLCQHLKFGHFGVE